MALFLRFIYFLGLGVLPTMSVPTLCRDQNTALDSGTGIMDSCESPNGCWELNLGLLQVVVTTEQSFQPQHVGSLHTKL